jgi:hypothetical protein
MERTDAIDSAIVELAGDLDTTTTSLLEQLGTTQEGLEGKIADLETALQEDIGEVSTAVSDLETSLLSKIDAKAAEGKTRDDALTESLEELSVELGVTEETLLTELGTTKGELSEQITGVSGQLTQISAELQAVSDLLGKPANLLTQEDIDNATAYLDSVEQENELLYDVDNNATFDQTDVDLMQNAFTTGDYSAIADSQFGVATGMYAQQEQDRQQIIQYQQDISDMEVARLESESRYQQDLEAQREAEIERQAQLRQDIAVDMGNRIQQQEEAEEQEKLMEALTEPGRKVTSRPGERAQIDYFYDISGQESGIFANPDQESFFGQSSPYGSNFLTDIVGQQRRAKGGMIKDKTDEILKIIGDK